MEDPAAMPDDFGPLDLLIIQPTPFCNIDCSYCYLPNRQSTAKITPALLHRTFENAFGSGLVRQPFTVIWHAGEPMVLPPDFYRKAFAICHSHNSNGTPVVQAFQTNGTMIDEDWIEFIQESKLQIGVSIDGPAFLHDRHRKTRQGKGTHHRVMEGIRLLTAHEIPFHVITVLTSESLDYPDELFDFYCRHGIERVGFNIEEIEGPNTGSSLQSGEATDRYKRFLSRFFDLATRGPVCLHVREFDGTLAGIFHPGERKAPRTHENMPLAIITVDCEGNFSSFSPELLGLPSKHYGDFTFGNVATDLFGAVTQSTKFQRVHQDIRAGIEQCRQSCSYFNFCGGGAPGNKYFENGTFLSTETMFCRLTRKAMLDVVVDKLTQSPPDSGQPSMPIAQGAEV